jgi:hypothetical protein
MNEEELLRTLARSAKTQPPPAVDVAGAVVQRIRSPRSNADSPLIWMAGLSAAAAAILLVYSVGLWSAWRDPVTELLLSTTPVLQ